MDRKDHQTPQGEIAQILVEFLEVAITSVVFLKGVYPNGAFERRRYMNLVVHRAKHPQLNEYIHSAVNGLLPFLTKDLIDRVAVVFFDDGGVPIERFVFKLNVNLSYNSKVQQADLEFSLRSFLIKLPVSGPLTKVLPQNCRWEITAYFRALPQASTSKDAEMWIPSDAKQWQQPPVITPIKSLSSEPLSLQVYAEDRNLSVPTN
ncbi:DNA-binding HORMA family protein [Perilla frutescens var. hirtella]|uniref:DNA-binding HORMA family protein n=1 Tax=Perilla frutescens var. hirtella TaxID=608512 RepID=A0AAD4JD11_PERFH|nr:DNA-binding HORMA family protein [Perilla frutescens var. hirtella]